MQVNLFLCDKGGGGEQLSVRVFLIFISYSDHDDPRVGSGRAK